MCGATSNRREDETGFVNRETGVRLKKGESDADFTKRVDEVKGKPAPVQDPQEVNDAIRRAREQETKRARGAKGRQSTLLTSPLGEVGEPVVKRKTLMGS